MEQIHHPASPYQLHKYLLIRLLVWRAQHDGRGDKPIPLGV